MPLFDSVHADLAAAVERNCVCQTASNATEKVVCAPHRMLTEDQRALNGLFFVRRIANRLRVEEYFAGFGHSSSSAITLASMLPESSRGSSTEASREGGH